MRRTIDNGIELLTEAKASVKNAYRMAPPELAKLRKPSKMLLNTGFSRPVQAPYGVHILPLKKKDRSPQQCIDRRIQSKLTVRRKYPLPAFDYPCGVKYFPRLDIRSSLTDAKGGKCCSVQSQINVLGHVGECHQSGLLREEDTQWSGILECQAAFNGLKQAWIEGLSLGVVDATKTPKVEAEQFSCVFEEYLHHYVDGRQKNWVQLLNVTQFGRSAQTDSLIKRSPFAIKGNRHYVLPPLADGPYVGDRPQVHRVGQEWKQMADIARVYLEETLRPMEIRVDQKRCPIEFEWMTKLPINGAPMPYDYLSTWT
ncbi:reverse transcriptase [Cucumis melo var. makuwa]|uniref:Reverse transcriptase n=1 Tax=Cucumis melo var. makuwa TaxID=1194695 RepID=A0A5D3DBR5_CUCMM|nr:reverse transcriptase [Cucumis melo var. makuwa]TYK20910.1 reverse transcriptase [Cucumis melo var. makuwa]